MTKFFGTPRIMNRDLKMENVVVGHDGRPKLCDFGFSTTSKGCDVTSERTGDVLRDMGNITMVGTPVYMAPELSRAACGYDAIKADMWSM